MARDFTLTTTLAHTLGVFQEVGVDFPVQYARVLFILWRDEERAAVDLAKEMDLSPSSMSRMVNALGENSPSRGFRGHGMVQSRMDPMDRRRRILSLTPKGQRLVEESLELWQPIVKKKAMKALEAETR